jgi:hypothetical protein
VIDQNGEIEGISMDLDMKSIKSTSGNFDGGDKKNVNDGQSLLQTTTPIGSVQHSRDLVASSTILRDAVAGNSVANDAAAETDPPLVSESNAVRKQPVVAGSSGANLIVPMPTDLNLASVATPMPKSPLQIGNEPKQPRHNDTRSDKNAPVSSYATSNITAPSNYSSSKNASEFSQQQILQRNESTAAGEFKTKNGTFDNSTENNSSAANSNSEGKGDLNIDESAENISHADNASDAAIRDTDIQNANGTKGSNNSSSDSDDLENAEEDAEESTSSTDGEIAAADDKDEEEAPPDYNDNELDANGQPVNYKPF